MPSLKIVVTVCLSFLLCCQRYTPQVRSKQCPDVFQPCIIECESSFPDRNKKIKYDLYAPTSIHHMGYRLSEFEFHDLNERKVVKINNVLWEMAHYRCTRVKPLPGKSANEP